MKRRSAETVFLGLVAIIIGVSFLSAFTPSDSFKTSLWDSTVVLMVVGLNGIILNMMYKGLSQRQKYYLRFGYLAKLNIYKPSDALDDQYAHVHNLKRKIKQFRVVGESDGQIRLHLKKDGWDPQIIELGLRRMR